MPGQPKIITVDAQRVETCAATMPGTYAAAALVSTLVLGNLALFPAIQQAARLPMTIPVEDSITWSLDAPRLSYKPGAPKKVLLVNDSYRQMRNDVENFTQTVAGIRQGIRQQIALSDVMLALRTNRPGITPEEAQKLLLEAGYDIPTPEVAQALHEGESQFLRDDNAARTAFAGEIAKEIIADKIGGFLKNIELITRVGQYVLLGSNEKQ